MVSDGAALRPDHTRSPSGEVTRKLQRAIPDKQGWESLGALPASGTIALVAGAGINVLWQLKGFVGSGDALTTVYTATYP
jgi:hypothetical protein